MVVPDTPVVNALRHAMEYLGLGDRIAPFPIRREARPFTPADFPPLAANLESGAPDYIGVGTQKSGTSWWAGLIEDHPNVSPNVFDRKETHYLSHFLEQKLTEEDIKTYHAAFARPQGQRCGEWTPNYLANPHALVNLRKVAPNAKVLVMFRNPIDRFESGFNHELKQRFGGLVGPKVRLSVVKKYALRTESIWNGMYGAQSDILLDHVERDRVLVLQYEHCRRDPETMIARTYRFLGLDDSHRPSEMGRLVNVQRRVTVPLDNETRDILTGVYRSDVVRLKSIFPEAIHLDLWPEFDQAA